MQALRHLVRHRMAVLLSAFFILSSASLLASAQTAAAVKPDARASQSASAGSTPGTAAQRQALIRWREQQMRMAMSHAQPHRQAASTATSGGGIIETIAGSAPFQAPTTALKAGLGQTQGVVEDANGNLFVSTGDLRTVLKIDTTGNVTVYAGQPLPSGPAQATGDGGPATAATLVFPVGLALDAAGNLYIADSGSFTVREVAAATGIISTIAGVTDIYGHTGDGGPATSAHLQYVQSLVIDGSGNLFIADTGLNNYLEFPYFYVGFVREVNLATGLITTVAGADYNASPVCNLQYAASCPALNVQLTIGAGPSSLAVYQDTLYLTVTGGFEGPTTYPGIMSISLSTGSVQTLFGITRLDYRAFESTLATDQAGNLDIASGGMIYQLAPGGTTLTSIAGNGSLGYSGDGGPATSAMLDRLGGIAVTPSNSIIFFDSGRIRQIDTNGIITTIAGDGTANVYGDGNAAQTAGIDSPDQLAVDGKGDLFINDAGDNLIRRISQASGAITTVAGNGLFSETYPSGPTNSLPGDGGPATAVPTSDVFGIASDGGSNLYIGMFIDGIRVVNTDTGTISTLNNSVQVTGGMVFDGNKTLYAASSYSVVAVDTTTGNYTYITGDPSVRNVGILGDGGPAVNAAPVARALALDGKGNLYIADMTYVSVRIVNLSTGIINTIAGPTAINYNRLDAGDGGPALAATFASIDGLSTDGSGHLEIADRNGNTIRQVDLTTNIITTVAGIGTPGYSGDGAAATAATFNGPSAVAADSNGNLYIADTQNDRIRRIVQSPASLTATLTGSAASITAGTATSYTVDLTGFTYGYLPTGMVTLYDGTTALATSTNFGLPTTTGAPHLDIVFNGITLAVGTHSITAAFAGDGNYAAVTTAPVTVTVTAPIPPSFTIAAAPSSLSIKQGASGTAVFTVTPAGGFNAAVNFACGSGLPTGVTCSFSPASVTPAGSTPVTTTLTITTTGATLARLNPAAGSNTRPGGRWWIPGGTASLACLLLLGLPARRRKAASWFAMLACAVLLGAGWLGMAGCSGGSSGPKPNPDATPPGSYTITLTATSGTGPTALTQPGTLALTVTQ